VKVKKIKNLTIPLGVLLFISIILNIFFYQKSKVSSNGIEVLGVIDGDTLVLAGQVRIRLRSLDAPELTNCGGPEAKAELEKWVSGEKVEIKERVVDQQGRPMAFVYVGNTLVNLKMLQSGWARFHSDTSGVRQQLKEAGDQAKQNSLGIFSPKCYQKTNPDNPQCVIKGNINKVSGKKTYFYPGCAQYEFTIIEKDLGEDWFCTEKEAQKAGFTKAETCPKNLRSYQAF